MSAKSARSYIVLSIVAAIVTISLKASAYFLTGSVGLLSDALESCINLIAALVGFWALSFAAKPPDAEHAFGHSKAEYFSSGLESALIMVAAVSIAGSFAVPKATQLGEDCLIHSRSSKSDWDWHSHWRQLRLMALLLLFCFVLDDDCDRLPYEPMLIIYSPMFGLLPGL